MTKNVIHDNDMWQLFEKLDQIIEMLDFIRTEVMSDKAVLRELHLND